MVFWTFLLPGALVAALLLPGAARAGLGPCRSASGPGRSTSLITGTLDNYRAALDPIYLGLLWKSFWIAGAGHGAHPGRSRFPVALAVSFAPPRAKPLLLMLVILPFWTNLLIRTYAMIAVLRTRGYVNFGARGAVAAG